MNCPTANYLSPAAPAVRLRRAGSIPCVFLCAVPVYRGHLSGVGGVRRGCRVGAGWASVLCAASACLSTASTRRSAWGWYVVWGLVHRPTVLRPFAMQQRGPAFVDREVHRGRSWQGRGRAGRGLDPQSNARNGNDPSTHPHMTAPPPPLRALWDADVECYPSTTRGKRLQGNKVRTKSSSAHFP